MLNRHQAALAMAMSLLVLGACASTGEPGAGSGRDVSGLIFIGDSNLDIGRAMTERAGDMDDGKVVPPNTVGERYSNGMILPEYLVQRLGIPQTNYAWGGATSGRLNIGGLRDAPDLRETGALAQLDEFEADLSGRPANADALYMVMAGSNDLANVDKSDQAAIENAIGEAVANLRTIVTRLEAAGAELIVIGTRTPRPVVSEHDRAADEPDAEAKNDAAGRQLNVAIRELAAEMDGELDADVDVFDFYAGIRAIIANAPAYGLAPYTPAQSEFCIEKKACEGLVNHDGAHKTSAVHAILAGQFIQQFGLGARPDRP